MCVEVIVCYIIVIFLRHGVYISSTTYNVRISYTILNKSTDKVSNTEQQYDKLTNYHKTTYCVHKKGQ